MTAGIALGRVADAYDCTPPGFHPSHWARFQPDPDHLEQSQNRLPRLGTDALEMVALQLLGDLQAHYAIRLDEWIEDRSDFLARAGALDAEMQARGYTPSADYTEGLLQAMTLTLPLPPDITDTAASGRSPLAAKLAAFSDDTLRGFFTVSPTSGPSGAANSGSPT